MEKQKKKCSFEDHREIDATFYCCQCEINICNKCENFHSKLCKNHRTFPLDKNIDEIFTGVCKENNHNYNDLSFFCKTHNQLCCVACCCKIKTKEIGNHRDCEICLIENIKDEKINKLKDNIKNLEELSNNISKSINDLKEIFEKINKNKEELKANIQKIFTGIRNELNNREDELLLEVEKQYNNLFFKEEFIKETQKLPNRIKICLEKGKQITDKNYENKLNVLINDCINIENIIEEINTMNKNIQKCKDSADIYIDVNFEKEKEINKAIKTFGKIEIKSKEEENYYNLYNDFNIQLKEPIHKLNQHTDDVYCLTVLNDGRLVSGSNDKTIIIYNKITYQSDLIIKEHNNNICCITQLSSGELVSCSYDKEIKIFKIKDVEYEILQTLKYHTNYVYKIIELKNKNLVSCSEDSSIIFYNKDNLEYKINYKLTTNGRCTSVIQVKDNEICYSENNNGICFYDLLEKKIKSSLSNIDRYNGNREWFIMMNKDLLLIPGNNKISIVNVNQYKLVRVIEVPNSSWICGVCILNQNMILTGDYEENIIQWKIDGDNLILVSKKEKVHNYVINVLINLRNGHIACGFNGGLIQIW